MSTVAPWPYLPTFLRLALALTIGLFIGIERERRGKEAGLRTFTFAALIGAVGGLLGEAYALLAVALVGVLVVLLAIETMRTGEGVEITTSAALLVTAFAGLLAGQGHTFTPTALGVVTAALLAWKEPLSGFSHTVTESELRSAALLAILAFVIYPILPRGSVDPWHLVDPRSAWVTVILVAALGFVNYVLLKVYGTRGIELTGFLGGLINSTVTVTELAHRVRLTGAQLSEVAYRGVVLATIAMLLRNAVILGIFAPAALLDSSIPLAFMLAGAVASVLLQHPWRAGIRFSWHRLGFHAPAAPESPSGAPLTVDATDGHQTLMLPTLESPFSFTATIRFGLLFLALQVGGALAQLALGQTGFYVVCIIGGLVSSASAVASAAALAASGAVQPEVAGLGAILASLVSALIGLPLVARFGGDKILTQRVARVLVSITVLGAFGVLILFVMHSL